jgi:hypothetical protein
LQVNLQGKTRLFDPYKRLKSLATYFRTALRFVSYFYRVVAPDEYHFSAVTDPDDDSERQRPEDIIEATKEQLSVWRDINRIAQQKRMKEQNSDNSNDDDKDSKNKLKEHLLELWILLIYYMTSTCQYELPLLSFCAMLSIKLLTKS